MRAEPCSECGRTGPADEMRECCNCRLALCKDCYYDLCEFCQNCNDRVDAGAKESCKKT